MKIIHVNINGILAKNTKSFNFYKKKIPTYLQFQKHT